VFTLDPLSDASLVDAVRVHAQWQDPCDIEEREGLLLVAGSTRFPGAYLNCVLRLDAKVSPQQLMQRAHAFFDARERGFTVITRASRDADLEAVLMHEPRFELRSESPCMRVTQPLPVPALPEGMTVQAMSSTRHVEDAGRVHAQAYALLGMPDKEVHKLFAHPERVLQSPLLGCVVYLGDEPVASALAIQSEGAAGIYWVGTAPSAHRKGLATFCTAWVTQRSFEHGVRSVNLQASVMGAPVYARLGFEPFDRMRWYVCRAERRTS
jgi:GNAT superfamily N-acetyltransferase